MQSVHLPVVTVPNNGASTFDRWFNDEASVRAGFAIALMMLIAIAAFSYHSVVVMDESSDLVEHSHEVQTRIAEIDALYARARARWRGYITNGNAEVFSGYKAAVTELLDRIDTLQILIADNAEQQSHLKEFRALASAYIASMDETAGLKSAGELQDGTDIFGELSRPRVPVAKAMASLNQMSENEILLLSIRQRENKKLSAAARVVLIAGTTASIVVLVLAFFLLSRQMRRLGNAKHDISALNVQLLKRTDSLETTNKELESFSYSVSHDLRAPLRAIGGYAVMLAEDHGPQLDADGKRYLAVIRSEADRMGLLIDELLAFSRLGRDAVNMLTFDMTSLVREVIAELRPTATAATRIEIAALPVATGDRALLHRVWVNLIANAIKYASKREKPVVRISGRIDGDAAVYRIEDNGAGFDMRHYGKLFGVFQRLHSVEEFPGTGIGLAIVQRVVERHDGRVWAESELDHGAVFHFSLPTEAKPHGQ